MPTVLPKELNISFWAILAAGVLVLIIGFVGFPEAMVRQELSRVPDFETQLATAGLTLDQFLGAFKSMLLVMSVIAFAIYVLIGFMVRRGSNVARIFATVLAALSLLMISGSVLSILAVVLGIIGVVFAWLRPSSNYIAARRAARAAGFR